MTELNLTDCDLEPVHLIGRVQPHGAVLAMDANWIVTHASENIGDFVGIPAKDAIGQPIAGLLSEDAVHRIRTKVQMIGGTDTVLAIRGETFPACRVDVSVSHDNGVTLLDIERHAEDHSDGEMSMLAPILARLPDTDDIKQLTKAVARGFKALTGFDRVMVYRFAKDGTGEVIAEVAASGMDPYLGLRYPATDIPKQARALLLRNPVRLIADVSDPGVAILGQSELDLSLSGIRAVSPIHLEYLRNMGVASTMTVSLIVSGRLWGLVSLHHRQPFAVPMALRHASQLLGELISQRITATLIRQEINAIALADSLHEPLLNSTKECSDIAQILPQLSESLGTVISFDALAFINGDQIFTSGNTWKGDALRQLLSPLIVGQSMRQTNDLGKAASEAGLHDLAGALAIPLLPGQAVFLLRRQVTQTIRWAGAPTKKDNAQGRLQPRASFEAWSEEKKEQSEPWSDRDVRIANRLRTILLEMTLNIQGNVESRLRRTSQNQDTIISELNHRVRNVFALVRGIITQSRTVQNRDEINVILDRISALTQAHDQLTHHNGVSLSRLLKSEVQAFTGANEDKLTLVGPDQWASADAAPTIALVLHELVTNAVKYGALSNQTGTVKLSVDHDDNEHVVLTWEENGGPEVQEPDRRGFGSTIIENSIPFELGGEAEVHYCRSGLRVTLRIPAGYFEPSGQNHPPAEDEEMEELCKDPLAHIARLFLVEDNALIAMDVADSLEQLGAREVVVIRSVADGMEQMKFGTPDFAILDVNLGGESSQALAEHLVGLGCPIALATGYGRDDPILQGFPDAPLMQKPYDRGAIARLAGQLLKA
ncbi:HWE histidine kinase domain-containing protein [Aliiroseovarius sp. PTFE2010]|uniref:HWE histidine kinase domain-containing protein n=1 Tax=Aliiroseovarius sp. PTFE2010 TaxID=3417190 RepID=UPI003CEAD3A4